MSQSTEPDLGSTDRTSDTRNSGVRAALAHRDFRRYTLGRFFATLVWQMLGVAVGWQVYSITRDPLDLGLVGLAQFLPFFALVLPAGQLADRRDRRLVIVAAYLIETLCVLTLIWFSWSGSKDVRWVFLAMALFGAGRAMWMPASQAMVVNLVPTAVFPAAVAFNSTLFEVAVITGPAVGGLLYAFGESRLQISGALLVYCTGFVLLVIAITLIAGIRPRRAATPTDPVSWREFTLGLRFVFQRRTVLGAISLDLFAVLFGGATALLPMFAADILHVGPEGLGILRTAPGVGAALTALWLARRPISRHAGAYMFGGVAVFGLATIVFGLSTSFWLSACALFCLGAGDMVSVFVRHLLVQLETPDAIRGRVSAVSAMFIGASNELGEFESGLTASWWGPVRAVTLGGIACLVVVAGYLKLFPELRRLDRFPQRP
ncbi:MAG: MFS transporter [Gammaproteobacteria bacterium]|nr:MFS transporter [Gammaproteobacteria bacterium]MBM4224425.1 MFS transporter [Gammaproteobacteria bacterium]MBM4229241.1 MFS transporter [Gammaproteobacteria bacterium]